MHFTCFLRSKVKVKQVKPLTFDFDFEVKVKSLTYLTLVFDLSQCLLPLPLATVCCLVPMLRPFAAQRHCLLSLPNAWCHCRCLLTAALLPLPRAIDLFFFHEHCTDQHWELTAQLLPSQVALFSHIRACQVALSSSSRAHQLTRRPSRRPQKTWSS